MKRPFVLTLAILSIAAVALAWRPIQPVSPPADPAIAFARPGPNAALMVMNSDGSNRTAILTGVSVAAPSWSPDGQSLAFRVGTSTGGDVRRIDVQVMNGVPRGLNQQVLASASCIGDPAWSPAGDVIAFSQCGGKLSRVAAAGGPVQVVYQAPSGHTVYYPTWSSDASRIAFRETDTSGVQSVKILHLATATVVTALVWQVAESIREFDWARGGLDQIAFEAYLPTQAGPGSIHILDLATATTVVVTKGSGASWSPDNTAIAFSDSKSRLKTITLATGSVLTLAPNGAFHPDWRRF